MLKAKKIFRFSLTLLVAKIVLNFFNPIVALGEDSNESSNEYSLINIKLENSNITANNSLIFRDEKSDNIESIKISCSPKTAYKNYKTDFFNDKIIFRNELNLVNYDLKDHEKVSLVISLNNKKDSLVYNFEKKSNVKTNQSNVDVKFDIAIRGKNNDGWLSGIPIIGYFFTSSESKNNNVISKERKDRIYNKNILYISPNSSISTLNKQSISNLLINKNYPLVFLIFDKDKKIDVWYAQTLSKEDRIIKLTNFGHTLRIETNVQEENSYSPMITKKIIEMTIPSVKKELGDEFVRKIFGFRETLLFTMINKLRRITRNDSLAYVLSFEILVLTVHLLLFLIVLKIFSSKTKNSILNIFSFTPKVPLNDNNFEIKKYTTIILALPDLYILYEIMSTFSSILKHSNFLDTMPLIGICASGIDTTNVFGSFKLLHFSLSKLFMIICASVGTLQEENTSTSQKLTSLVTILIFLQLNAGTVGQNIILGLFLMQKNILRNIIEKTIKKIL